MEAGFLMKLQLWLCLDCQKLTPLSLVLFPSCRTVSKHVSALSFHVTALPGNLRAFLCVSAYHIHLFVSVQEHRGRKMWKLQNVFRRWKHIHILNRQVSVIIYFTSSVHCLDLPIITTRLPPHTSFLEAGCAKQSWSHMSLPLCVVLCVCGMWRRA